MKREPRAFPVVVSEFAYEHDPGMSLRAYFAAAALTGILASGAPMANEAGSAWRLADKMMKAQEES